MNNFDSYVLGISDSEIEIDTAEENQQLVLAMVRQAALTLEIFSRDLDHRIYDNIEFVEAVSQLARAHPHSRIRILVLDTDTAVHRGHRLVELMRRLSSSIEIRVVHPDYRHRNSASLTVDGVGWLFREFSDRYECIANFNDPGRTRELVDEFNEIWEHSTPASELRRLHI